MLKTSGLIKKMSISNGKLLVLGDEEVKDVQKVLLDMLADFDAFCRKNELSYFLCGGSALGAQRHGGFIPWDDDIDIAMPRADYDRMYELFLEEYGGRYWVQNVKGSDNYDLPFMKIRKKGTRYIEIFETNPNQAGVFIDVYPLENLPDFPIARFFHGIICNFLHLCCSCVRIHHKKHIYLEYFGNLRVIKIKDFLGRCLSFMGIKKWCRLADRWASKCKNSNSKFVSFPSGRKDYFGEMLHRSSVFPLKDCCFDGQTVSVMSDPTEHLTILYGDYSIIPPKECRERHAVITFDLGVKNE